MLITDEAIQAKKREHSSILAINLGLGANVLLAGLKTTMGIVGHSPALLADGINSTSDVAYYVIVWVFMRFAGKPADDEHPYGHRQLESIAALLVGAFIITTAVAIFWNSINQVYYLWIGARNFQGASLGALVVGIGTVVLKLMLTFITRRIGQQTRNPAVFALAYDHRNDTFAALAASVGILFGRIGYPWVDPLASSLVAMVILSTGINILRESSGDLMDTVPGKVLQHQVNEILMNIPGVEQVEEVLAHRFGPYLVIYLTVGIDGSLSVAEGDDIATRIEQTLHEEISLLQRVHVHYHPVQG